ncbi:unnamed protein product [Protopolystoma xenopodis]|uniref:Uncharacterized protein n=1 Tax=Protopolystoma xenopodis TaxID=117903 RepID=A0A3S5BFJ7_9PLAT|nr:unnamed protein product [Protopolystoma xenopodis]
MCGPLLGCVLPASVASLEPACSREPVCADMQTMLGQLHRQGDQRVHSFAGKVCRRPSASKGLGTGDERTEALAFAGTIQPQLPSLCWPRNRRARPLRPRQPRGRPGLACRHFCTPSSRALRLVARSAVWIDKLPILPPSTNHSEGQLCFRLSRRGDNLTADGQCRLASRPGFKVRLNLSAGSACFGGNDERATTLSALLETAPGRQRRRTGAGGGVRGGRVHDGTDGPDRSGPEQESPSAQSGVGIFYIFRLVVKPYIYAYTRTHAHRSMT